jgi:integrase
MGVKIRQKNKGGPWFIFVCHQGKRLSKKVGTKKNAEIIKKGIELEIAKNEFNFTHKETDKPSSIFKDVAERYISNIEGNPELAPKTKVRYRGILKKHLLPVFKLQNVENITRADMIDYLMKSRNDGFSTPETELRLIVMNGIFKRAISEGLMLSAPTSDVKQEIRLRRVKTNKDPLNFEETKHVLTVLDKHFGVYAWFYPMVYTAVKTGLRLGELLALQWECIDFHSKQIHVKRTYDREFGPPKHNKERLVDMPDSLVSVLKSHLSVQKKRGLKIGLGEAPELVFCNEWGRVNQQNQIRRVWKRLLIKADIRYHKFHSTRSTYASHLISLGADIYYVSKQLGHHSVTITERSYASFIQRKDTKPQVNILDSNAPNRATRAIPLKAKTATR